MLVEKFVTSNNLGSASDGVGIQVLFPRSRFGHEQRQRLRMFGNKKNVGVVSKMREVFVFVFFWVLKVSNFGRRRER